MFGRSAILSLVTVTSLMTGEVGGIQPVEVEDINFEKVYLQPQPNASKIIKTAFRFPKVVKVGHFLVTRPLIKAEDIVLTTPIVVGATTGVLAGISGFKGVQYLFKGKLSKAISMGVLSATLGSICATVSIFGIFIECLANDSGKLEVSKRNWSVFGKVMWPVLDVYYKIFCAPTTAIQRL